MTSMHTGDYTNIAIPRSLIHQAHLDIGLLSFELCSDGLLIKSSVHPRAGWEKYYVSSEKEENLLETIDGDLNEEDWQWQ